MVADVGKTLLGPTTSTPNTTFRAFRGAIFTPTHLFPLSYNANQHLPSLKEVTDTILNIATHQRAFIPVHVLPSPVYPTLQAQP